MVDATAKRGMLVDSALGWLRLTAIRLSLQFLFTLTYYPGALLFVAYIRVLASVSWVKACIGRQRSGLRPAAAAHDRPKAGACGSAPQASSVPAPRPTSQGSLQNCPVVFTVEKDVAPGTPAWNILEPLVQQYGHHAVAHSMLHNPEFHHFYVASKGSLVYCPMPDYHRTVIMVVGEPLAPPEHWGELTDLFLEQQQKDPPPQFSHLTKPYARLLVERGYLINEMGRETVIQVQKWSYTNKTRTIRAAARNARAAGVAVREVRHSDLNPRLLRALEEEVSGSWLQQKAVGDKILRLMIRHVDYQNLSLTDGVRLFVAEVGGAQAAPAAPAAAGQAVGRSGRVRKAAPVGSNRTGQRPGAAPHSAAPPTGERLPGNSTAHSRTGRDTQGQDMPPLQQRQEEEDHHQQQQQQGEVHVAAAGRGDACDGCNIERFASADLICSLEMDASTSQPLLKHSPGSSSSSSKEACVSDGSSSWPTSKSCGGSTPDTCTSSPRHADTCGLQDHPCKETAAAAGGLVLGADATHDSRVVGEPTSSTGVGRWQAAAREVPHVDAQAAEQQADGSRLVGFLLLDPVWKGGEVSGYVTSVTRTTCDAHPGAMKLLVEEALSVLAAEGKTTLNFGFAPFWNNQDTDPDLPGAWWVHWGLKFIFHFCNNLYAFKNLAFAKTRYGGGLSADPTRFRDPNVLMPPIYSATWSRAPGMAVLDQYILLKYVGMTGDLADTLLKMWGLRAATPMLTP